jgi:hypothetical protein
MYALYADGLSEHGPGHITTMIRTYNESPPLWIYPSPTRIGYLWLVAVAMKLVQSVDVSVVAGVSTVASIATLALAALLAWRWFGPWTAAAATLFLAVSPLDLAVARRGWQESVMAFLSLALLICAAQSMRARRRGAWMAAFPVLGAYSLLVKETALVLFGLAALGLVVHALAAGRRREATLIAGGAIAAALVATGVLLVAAGGVAPLEAIYRRVFVSPGTSAYLEKYQRGGPMYYVTGLAILHPLPVLLGLVGCVLAILRPSWMAAPERRLDVEGTRPAPVAAVRYLGTVVLAFVATALVYSQKNLRFLSPVWPVIDLFAGVCVVLAVEALGARLSARGARVAAAVVVSAVADVMRFHHFFIEAAFRDLATPLLQGK